MKPHTMGNLEIYIVESVFKSLRLQDKHILQLNTTQKIRKIL